jgi:hypothetical protein
MAGLPPLQEQKLIDALVGLGWKKDIEGASSAAIVQALDCSDAEAKAMLDYIYLERGLIRQVNSMSEGFEAYSHKSVHQWRWLAT